MKKQLGNKMDGNDRKRVRKMLAFLDSEVDTLVRRNKLGLAENYRSSGRSLLCYLTTQHRKDIPLRKLSEELLFGYQQWLQERGVKKNTSVFYMRNLHAVYNKAVKGGLVADAHPFVNIPTNITHPHIGYPGDLCIQKQKEM